MAVLAAEACRDSGLCPVYLTIFLANGGEEHSVQSHLGARLDGSRLNIDFLRAIPICAAESED